MSGIELFRKKNLSEVAQTLEVHPFDLARHFGATGHLPHRLQIDEESIETLRRELGVLSIWSEDGPSVHDPNPRRGLLRELSGRLLDANFTNSHRADNWYRGLVEEQQFLITQAINLFIELDVLLSISTPGGLHIQIVENKRNILELIFDGSDIPSVFDELWGA